MTNSPTEWDVIVVGAGPAGSISALLAARRGLRTLLVDKSKFPRTKVCGSCLNQGLVELLAGIGLDPAARFPTAPTLERATFNIKGRPWTFPLSGGMAISREALDHWLVEECIQENVHFMPETSARIGPSTSSSREVTLSEAGTSESRKLRARAVIAATGLAGITIQGNTKTSPRWRSNRVGIGAIADEYFAEVDRGEILMFTERWGYAGLVRLEDNRIDIAAAVDPRVLRECGSPLAAMSRLLKVAALSQNLPDNLQVRGTPLLTGRSRSVAIPRLFLVGDAAAYAEPFSGEGMHWAVLSSTLAAGLVEKCATGGPPSDLAKMWQREWSRSIGRNWRRCLLFSQALRYPDAMSLVSGMIPAPERLKESLAVKFSGHRHM